jgi:hypothetical protein
MWQRFEKPNLKFSICLHLQLISMHMEDLCENILETQLLEHST